ncbi:MAG: hypothetical protein HY544_04940 [Candidatus Diapherotrites archaeon]|uniref:Uncharacterized protein n=1 Tax=Candidatus Iainarchaeum sp. TaxID=3101447 RepID=A0A8T3YKR7_9ARCH|nr:hypothetical protein [Candidatus Diapherotrites archaeon]
MNNGKTFHFSGDGTVTSTEGNARERGKKFVLDSSSVITISDNCLIKVMRHLSDAEKISFMIPESVYEESVERPLRIKRFELNAIRIRDAVNEGYISVSRTTPGVKRRLAELDAITRSLCTVNGKPTQIVQLGESETLALVKETGADCLVIDERTTRMLVEDPEDLFAFLQRRLEGKVTINPGAVKRFRQLYGDVKIVRSVELIALAYEDGSLDSEVSRSRQALEAALYAAKFAGCAVSFDEIQRYMREMNK